MTWAEFQIRLFAYKRIETKEWEKYRIVAYCALIGANQDPKKLPKTINKFLPLDSDGIGRKTISDEVKNRFLEATKEYLNKVKNG